MHIFWPRRSSPVHAGIHSRDGKTRPMHFSGRQRGVAVVTALLLTTLAITIVASLFWQQQVQVRSIENQRLQLQKQWILRGALDFAVLILKEDAKHSGTVDDLGEPWSVPMQDTPLDQYVENGRSDTEASDASLSGNIVDAQSRFNLKNICAPPGLCPDPKAIAAFERLLTNLHLEPALAQATADFMLSAQQVAPVAPGSAPGAGSPGESTSRPLNIMYVEDLLSVPGFTEEVVTALKDFVIVLKEPTKVNANTASAEVLSAKSPNGQLSMPDALALVAARERKSFREISDFKTASGISDGAEQDFSTGTQYFLINGKVRLSRASMDMQALIVRDPSQNKASVLWIREN